MSKASSSINIHRRPIRNQLKNQRETYIHIRQARGVPGGGDVLSEESFSDSNQEIHFGFVHVEH